ncbi:unnamed protein product, partial [Mesorhabditis spiculigera]
MKTVDIRILFILSIQNALINVAYQHNYDYNYPQPVRVHPMLRPHQASHAINPVMQTNFQAAAPAQLPHPWLRPFRWTILPQNLCTPELKVIFVVHTAVSNKEKRAAIRETYGNMQWYEKYKIRTVFATGRSLDQNDEFQLENEARMFKDIVQADFVDHYRNLTIKGLTWMRYLRDFCPDVKLVVKLDDDLLPNIFGVMEDFNKNLIKTNRTFTCLLFYGKVIREANSPWYVPLEAMPENEWGRYCTGTSFMMSRDLVGDIIGAVEKRQHYVPVDDAFLTGPIGREVGATYDFDTYASKYELNDKHTEEKMMAKKVYFALYPTVSALRRMFGELQFIYKMATDPPDHFKGYQKNDPKP